MKRLFAPPAVLFALMLCQPQVGLAQSGEETKAMQEDIKALKEGQISIQKDLQEIKKLLQARPAQPAAQPKAEFKEAVITIEGAPSRGDKDAKLALLEFSDYQWPYCVRHVRETVPQIEKEYVETGKIKHVFMDFPLAMHQYAQKAAEAGLCAGDQGKFWEMHDKLFENARALGPDNLSTYAQELGLDMAKFKDCLDGGKHAGDTKQRMAEGQKAGITGTPAFLLGSIEPDGKVKAVKKLSGAQPYPAFKAAIEELLAPKK